MSDTTSDVPEHEFKFMSEQFLMHVGKIRDIHNERSALMRYSVIATFGYFAWLFLNQDVTARFAGNLLWLLAIWLVPFGFNLFGWWRNLYFLRTANKHGAFLNVLLTQHMKCRNPYREYLDAFRETEGTRREPIHPSKLFWIAILVVSLATAAFGVTVERTAGLQDRAIVCPSDKDA